MLTPFLNIAISQGTCKFPLNLAGCNHLSMSIKFHRISYYRIINKRSAEKEIYHSESFSGFDYLKYVKRSDNDLTQNGRLELAKYSYTPESLLRQSGAYISHIKLFWLESPLHKIWTIWECHANTWPIVGLKMLGSYAIHLWVVPREMLRVSTIWNTTTLLESLLYVPEANWLMEQCPWFY